MGEFCAQDVKPRRLPTVCQAQTNYQGDMFTKEAL